MDTLSADKKRKQKGEREREKKKDKKKSIIREKYKEGKLK